MTTSRTRILTGSIKLKKFMVYYQKVFNIKNWNYQAIYRMNYRQTSSKIFHFKVQYHSNLQQNRYHIRLFQSHLPIYINLNNPDYLPNRTRTLLCSKPYSIQVNHLLRSRLLYHKTYAIISINLHTKSFMPIEISIGLATISQLLI